MFQDICVFCNLALYVLLCLPGQFGYSLLLGVAELGLLFSFLLKGGCDSLVLPADLVCQTAQESKLKRQDSGENVRKK